MFLIDGLHFQEVQKSNGKYDDQRVWGALTCDLPRVFPISLTGRNRASRETDFLVQVWAPWMLLLMYFVIVAVVFNAEWTLSRVREVRTFCRGVMQYYQVLAEKWLKANVSCFLMVFNGFSNIYEPQLGIQQRIVSLLHFCSIGKQPK